MTLQEAIKHAEEKAQDPNACEGCRNEHRQLAGWLKELQTCKELLTDCAEWFDAMTGGEDTIGEISTLCKKIKKVVRDE